MVNVNDIKKIVEDSKKMGFQIKVGDISFLLLLREIKEHDIAYASIFGSTFSPSDIDIYESSPKMKFLKKYISSNYPAKKKDSDSSLNIDTHKYEDMSFEENKDALIKMLEEIENAEQEGKLEYKDAAKMKVDIRTKLNDKFAVGEKQDEQRVIVYSKYDAICPYCHHEVKSKSAEDAIAEIKEKYDLVPKEKENSK